MYLDQHNSEGPVAAEAERSVRLAEWSEPCRCGGECEDCRPDGNALAGAFFAIILLIIGGFFATLVGMVVSTILNGAAR